MQRLERRRVERHHHDLRVVPVVLEHLGRLLRERELEAALRLGDLEQQLGAVLADVGAGRGQLAAWVVFFGFCFVGVLVGGFVGVGFGLVLGGFLGLRVFRGVCGAEFSRGRARSRRGRPPPKRKEGERNPFSFPLVPETTEAPTGREVDQDGLARGLAVLHGDQHVLGHLGHRHLAPVLGVLHVRDDNHGARHVAGLALFGWSLFLV